MGGGDSSRQHRVFTLGLKRATVSRLARCQVHVPAEKHIHAKRAHLSADHISVLVRFIRIPARRTRKRRGKRGCRSHGVDVGVQKIRNSQPRYPWYPCSRVTRSKPVLESERAVHHLQLLIQCHLGYQKGGALI